jgi:hypothetical protein
MTTVREWQQAWADAYDAGPEAMDRLRAGIHTDRLAGIERGGPPCCGTTGIWHRPWCYTEPKDRTDEPAPDPLLILSPAESAPAPSISIHYPAPRWKIDRLEPEEPDG